MLSAVTVTVLYFMCPVPVPVLFRGCKLGRGRAKVSPRGEQGVFLPTHRVTDATNPKPSTRPQFQKFDIVRDNVKIWGGSDAELHQITQAKDQLGELFVTRGQVAFARA